MESWIAQTFQSDIVLLNNEFPVIVGLDFGTSNSCVSFWRDDRDRAKVVKNNKPLRSKLTPSTIAFHQSFLDYTVGDAICPVTPVRNDEHNNVMKTLFGLKRLLGANSLKEIPEHLKSICTFKESPETGEKLLYITCHTETTTGQTQEISVEELCGYMLTYLHNLVLNYFTKKMSSSNNQTPKIIGVVLGIPAYFPDRYKTSLRQAAILAGFPANGISYMIESTAAAMSYGLTIAGEKSVLVIDVGGGTTDLTIFHLVPEKEMEIVYTGGHRTLGGQEIDWMVYEQVLQMLCQKLQSTTSEIPWETLLYGPSPPASSLSSLTSPRSSPYSTFHPILLHHCRLCKESLTTNIFYTFSASELLNPWLSSLLPNTINTTNKTFHWLQDDLIVTRNQLRQWLVGFGAILTQLIHDALSQYHSKCMQDEAEDEVAVLQQMMMIEEIVMVGGSSRIPYLQQVICEAHQTFYQQQQPQQMMRKKRIKFVSKAMEDHLTQEQQEEEEEATAASAVAEGEALQRRSKEPSSKPKRTNKHKSQKAKKDKTIAVDDDDEEEEEEVRELCTSIDPDLAIVQGLAIRGAILTSQYTATSTATNTTAATSVHGHKLAHLKHLLMLDCLPMTIGILTRDPNHQTPYFVPILLQGTRLPIERHAVQRFPTVGSTGRKQSFVTLEIYEEVEDVIYLPSVDNNETKTGEQNEEQQQQQQQQVQKVYSYVLLVTTDVPITRLSSNNSKNGGGFVNVYMQVNEEGVLSYDVVEEDDNEAEEGSQAARKQARLTEASAQQTFWLGVLIAMLFGLYITFKLCFPPTIMTTEAIVGDDVVRIVDSLEGQQDL